jgi:hypothetical protein
MLLPAQTLVKFLSPLEEQEGRLSSRDEKTVEVAGGFSSTGGSLAGLRDLAIQCPICLCLMGGITFQVYEAACLWRRWARNRWRILPPSFL